MKKIHEIKYTDSYHKYAKKKIALQMHRIGI